VTSHLLVDAQNCLQALCLGANVMLLEFQAEFLQLFSTGITHPRNPTCYFMIWVLTVRLRHKIFLSILMNSRSGDSSKGN